MAFPGPVIGSLRLNKALYLLAQGKSKRAACSIAKIDRQRLSFLLGGNKLVPYKFATKVAKDVLQNHLTFDQIKKKYGIRGLRALNNYQMIVKLYRDKIEEQMILKARIKADPVENMPSVRTLSKTLNISKDKIYVKLRKILNSVRIGNAALMRGAKIRTTVFALWKQGVRDPYVISSIVKRTPQYVVYILNRYGIRVRENKTPFFTDRDYELIDRLRKTMTWREIATVFGCSIGSVYNFYVQYRIKPRRNENEKIYSAIRS